MSPATTIRTSSKNQCEIPGNASHGIHKATPKGPREFKIWPRSHRPTHVDARTAVQRTATTTCGLLCTPHSPILATALPYSSSDAIILTLPLPSPSPPAVAGLPAVNELCLASPLLLPLLPPLLLRPLRLLVLRVTLSVLGRAGSAAGGSLLDLLYGAKAALLTLLLLLLLLKQVPAGTRARDSTGDLNVGEAEGVVTALLELVVLRRSSLSLIFRSSEATDSSPGIMRCNRS